MTKKTEEKTGLVDELYKGLSFLQDKPLKNIPEEAKLSLAAAEVSLLIVLGVLTGDPLEEIMDEVNKMSKDHFTRMRKRPTK